MPYARGPVTPRNMGTQQCENIDVETQNTVGTDLGVHTSDPLLKVAKWIAYLTKIGPIVIAVVYLILLFLPYLLLLPMFFAIAHGLQALVYFAFFSLVGGVIGWCYLHFLWVKPSQYLLLGIQQVGTSLKEKFPITTDQIVTTLDINSVQILSHPVVCSQVCTLDVERLHPLRHTCILLLLLPDKEDKHPSLPTEVHHSATILDR